MSAALRDLLAKATGDNPWGGPFDRQDATNAILRELPAMLAEFEQMRAQRDGAVEQHGRDSAELRDLCAHRDTLKAALLAKSAAYDALIARIEAAPVVGIEDVEIDGEVYRAAFDDGKQFAIGQRVRLLLVGSEAGEAGLW